MMILKKVLIIDSYGLISVMLLLVIYFNNMFILLMKFVGMVGDGLFVVKFFKLVLMFIDGV